MSFIDYYPPYSEQTSSVYIDIWVCTLFSLALHPDKTMVATGQTGKNPFICVWDTATMETISILRDGHQNGIAAVGFDKEGGVSMF